MMDNEYDYITPEMIQALAEAGLIPEMQGLNLHALKQAEALRGQAPPQAHSIGSDKFGSIIKQPTPLEGLLHIAQQATGAMDEDQAKASLMANILRYRDTASQYGNAQRDFMLKKAQQAPVQEARPPGLDLNTGEALDPSMTYMPRMNLRK